MNERGAPPPVAVRRALRRLLPGATGMEIVKDLDREYSVLCERYPHAVARVWYLLQLLRPDTWRLAWALRRRRNPASDAGAAAGHPPQAPAGRPGQTAGRPARVRTWWGGLSLDLKLAWRMLVKSPILTVVGVLGIALGTAVGVGFFVFLTGFFFPKLPLEEGDRLVALTSWNAETSRPTPPALHEFVDWREEMRSVRQIAAASMGDRALVTGDAAPASVRAAAMTAAGFEVARARPLLGRYLVLEDELEGGPRVAVVGFDLWQARFGGDPGVLGRSILVDGVEHTVVGVMPPGFAFPHKQELWTSLRVSTLRGEPRDGLELFVFGRLAPGATRQQAQAELTTIGRRAASDSPDTKAHLRPQVAPYTHPLENIHGMKLWHAAQLQLMVTLLLIAIAVNISVLVYARTAMRQSEIAIRTALGASRRRIVAQLFVEALLLSILGAGLGLGLAHAALGQLQAIFDRGEGVAFWLDYGLQPRSVAFALALAVLAAVVVGVLPALKSTGRRLTADLRRVGGGATVPLGRAWTALIVAQVAIAVTVLPTAAYLGYQEIRMGAVRSTFPADEFLTARLGVALPVRPEMDGEAYRRETAARFAVRLPELERLLEAEPAVAGVTFEGRLPGRGPVIEVEGHHERRHAGNLSVLSQGVATDYFDVLGARILAGRAFRAPDVHAQGGTLIVSDAFVRRVLAGADALGRRVRFLPEPQPRQDDSDAGAGPWLEIVGVVEDLYASAFDRELAPPTVFYAIAPAELPAANLLVRVRGDAAAFAPQLRQIMTSVDPDFRPGPVESLATVRNARYLALAVSALQLVLGTVLLLCAAGIHALMSVTVTRRRKEIGIRTALGARAGHLLAGIFSRAAWQLGLGGVLGSLLGGALLLLHGLTGDEAAIFVGGVLVLMLTAGLLAAAGPARRGLRIQPLEALREE